MLSAGYTVNDNNVLNSDWLTLTSAGNYFYQPFTLLKSNQNVAYCALITCTLFYGNLNILKTNLLFQSFHFEDHGSENYQLLDKLELE